MKTPRSFRSRNVWNLISMDLALLMGDVLLAIAIAPIFSIASGTVCGADCSKCPSNSLSHFACTTAVLAAMYSAAHVLETTVMIVADFHEMRCLPSWTRNPHVKPRVSVQSAKAAFDCA